METTDVVVIGGGVIGSACAYYLTRMGRKVTLVEKHDIAKAASGASAGGVRQQNRLAQELPIAIRAIQMWPSLEEELGWDVEYRRQGHLTLIQNEEHLPALQESVRRQRATGLDIRLVQGSELRDLVPHADPTVCAGSYTPDDGFANPMLITKAFADAAERKGARVYTWTPVTSIRRQGDRVGGVETTRGPIAAKWVINAAGAWSPALSATIGVPLPIQPLGLQMMATERGAPRLRPVLNCIGRNLSLKQMPHGYYVIGGGWEGEPDLPGDRALAKAGSPNGSAVDCTAVFPPTRELAVARVWVGLEAQCFDKMPILGTVDGLEGYVLATGFSGHGFALAPYIGLLMAELIVDGKTSHPLDDLSLRRFARMDPGEIQQFMSQTKGSYGRAKVQA